MTFAGPNKSTRNIIISVCRIVRKPSAQKRDSLSGRRSAKIAVDRLVRRIYIYLKKTPACARTEHDFVSRTRHENRSRARFTGTRRTAGRRGIRTRANWVTFSWASVRWLFANDNITRKLDTESIRRTN